ncbi:MULTISPECIES: NUDIX hydrolase [Dickeya]|uniref:Putative MutT/nudix-family hydrolase n=1 Tax=Dickeya aquatica TaxID=1401087 RepID=A0A375A6K8_9GAMM|nr:MULTISPECIES: NUDIX domain-containing protein [Dickeya]SLM61289.1 putative MutT/nudix-family hydrolase [Dickeya aquatica]
MKKRPSSRLLILNPQHHVLLFLFHHTDDALAGKRYWATPGGALENGETFEQAALRELWEETGIRRQNAGPSVATRAFPLAMPNGETVLAEEQFFIIHTSENTLNTQAWTDHERHVMRDYHWWSREELLATPDIFYPENLAEMVWPATTSLG